MKRSPDSDGPGRDSSDRELIAAALDGRESAFATLIERYQDRIFRLLGRYCRDASECEDLAQEVFLKVFRKLNTFQHESQFFTWVYRITVNAATDHLAKAGRRRLRLVEDEAALDAVGQGRDEDRPDAPMLRAELAEVTRAILAEMPEKFRTILVLREFEELSYNEIAAVLQCQLGTVESRLFRARQRFREQLERTHPELVPTLAALTGQPAARGGSK